MTPIPNQRHELFAKGVASGLSGSQSYTRAYGPGPGAGVSANRLLKKANIANRISYLKAAVNAEAQKAMVDVVVSELRSKETRISRLASVATRIERVFEARAKAYATAKAANGKSVVIPGGDQGLVVPVFAAGGKIAYEVDTAVIREYRSTLQQIGEECGLDTGRSDMLDEVLDLIKKGPAKPAEPVTTATEPEPKPQ